MKAAITNRRMSFSPLKYSRMAPISTQASLEELTLVAAKPSLPQAPDETTRRRPCAGPAWQSRRRRPGRSVHHAVHLRAFAPQQLDHAVGDEARSDPVGDGVGEWHQGHGEERGETLLEIAEGNVPDE